MKGPLLPQPKTNLVGPQPDPSILESVALQVPTNPQPDQSKLKSITLQDPDDPQPGPSVLETAVLQDPDVPQPDPSVLKPIALQNPVVPRTLPPWPVQGAFRRRRRIGDPVPYIPPATRKSFSACQPFLVLAHISFYTCVVCLCLYICFMSDTSIQI